MSVLCLLCVQVKAVLRGEGSAAGGAAPEADAERGGGAAGGPEGGGGGARRLDAGVPARRLPPGSPCGGDAAAGRSRLEEDRRGPRLILS